MEQKCYQCGVAVEEGVAFCPQCGAPQIRVNLPDQPASVPLEPGTPGEIQPPATPVPLPQEERKVQWGKALPVAAVVGLGIALFTTLLALGGFGVCLWPVVGGAAAAMLYQRRLGRPISAGTGALTGMAAGAVGFALTAAFSVLQLLLLGTERFRANIREQLEKAAAGQGTPAAEEMIQRLLTPEGIALLFVLGLVLILGVLLLFSAVGGAIGASLSRRSSAS